MAIIPMPLPNPQLKFFGVYQTVEKVLEPIANTEDLKPAIFQTFREIGNMLAFVRDLSDVFDFTVNTQIFMNAAQFLGTKRGDDMELPLPGGSQHNMPSGEETPFTRAVDKLVAEKGGQLPK